MAIEYLLPSGLFHRGARPKMKVTKFHTYTLSVVLFYVIPMFVRLKALKTLQNKYHSYLIKELVVLNI